MIRFKKSVNSGHYPERLQLVTANELPQSKANPNGSQQYRKNHWHCFDPKTFFKVFLVPQMY